MNPQKELLALNRIDAKVTDCATYTVPLKSAVSIEELNDTSKIPALHWGLTPALKE